MLFLFKDNGFEILKFAGSILKRRTTVYNYVAETVAVLCGAGTENRTRMYCLASSQVTFTSYPHKIKTGATGDFDLLSTFILRKEPEGSQSADQACSILDQ